jgi:hypothetical protein
MRRQSSSIWPVLLVVTVASAILPAPASGLEPFCSGHQLLSTPRPEGSCTDVKPQVFASPDGALRAIVLPVDVSLDTSPDMESRVVIRGSRGDTLNSKDYSSPRGANGYYVVTAKWSPDSQFFAYSMSSSGGHSPWSFPLMVYSRGKNAFAAFSKMINDNPTVSSDFTFSGPHTLTATTWKKPGAIDDKVPISVNLEDAFNKLPPSSD